MKRHRVAVVGCGAIARGIHLPNVVKNPRAELIAACDVDPGAAKSCREEFGAKRAETDWRCVVEADDVDMIILATHTNLRSDLIVPALGAGKPVYVEKPLAASEEEMLEIILAGRETGVPVCVGHNRRSSPAMLEFRRLVDRVVDGAKPTPPSVDRSQGRERIPEEDRFQFLIRINDDSRSWKHWVFEDAQGIMFAEMVHFLDLALWLNPGRPVRLFVEGSRRGNFTIVLRFDDGSITTMQHTMVAHFDYPKELFEFTGRHFTVAMEQHIEIRQSGFEDEPAVRAFPLMEESSWARERGIACFLRDAAAEGERARKEGRRPRWIQVNKGHFEHLDRFLTHMEGKGPNPCNAASAVPVTRLALRCLESAAVETPVDVPPEDLETGEQDREIERESTV